MERNFSSKDYWEMRYQSHWDSGQGSYGKSAEAKGKSFNEILMELKPETLIELGCGDGHQLQFYNTPRYLGLDVSRSVIQKISEKYKNDQSKTFLHYESQSTEIPSEFKPVDMAISVDVIFHLVEDDVFESYMKDLFSFSTKWVAIYAPDIDEKQVVAHVKNRKFTDWVLNNEPDWRLEKVVAAIDENGEKFLNWHIFKRQSF